jgi:putative ABC transport system ATP-binding protein
MFASLAQVGAPPVVRVDRVNHCFGEGESRNQVLFDNCIEIGAGQFVIMTGPSGSGKTSLLSLIGALRSVQEGRIHVLDRDLTGASRQELIAIRRNIGFIFQAHNLFDSLSAYENIKMAMQLRDWSPTAMRDRGMTILERLGIGHRGDYKPRALSGGQRQRVAVARALVNQPKLILADEPTASLDKDSTGTVVNLLKELTVKEGCTVIMVSHDNRILELADRIVNMVDGRIISDVVLRDALMICEFLRTVPLFKHLTPAQLTNTAERMKRRHYSKNDIIIREGDGGDEFFLIGRGCVDVFKRENGEERRLATLCTGDIFGERALMVDEPRNSTCIATTEVEAFSLGKLDFTRALEASASFRDQIYSIYFQRQ